MKKFIIVIATICLSVSTQALADNSSECVAAVDAADSLNVNQPEVCDYSKTGLNGYLHKSLGKNKDAKDVVPADNSTFLHAPSDVAQKFSAEVNQWSAAPLTRNQLLANIFKGCPQGFRIVAEEYRPLAMGKLELSLYAVCLQ